MQNQGADPSWPAGSRAWASLALSSRKAPAALNLTENDIRCVKSQAGNLLRREPADTEGKEAWHFSSAFCGVEEVELNWGLTAGLHEKLRCATLPCCSSATTDQST